jgi:phosphoglycerate kinase
MSHLGRPKGGPEEKYSLRHILPVLSELLGREVQFAPDCVGEEAFHLSRQLQAGGVLLLENVRFHPAEEQGDAEFAQRLSQHGTVYVNDAFGAAHREHASTATVARFFGDDRAAGFLMEAEVKNADKVMKQAQRPFTAIMGGAKVSDKILIIENLMDRVDNLVIVGAMAYTFMRAMGGQTGASLCEEDKLDLARTLMQKAEQRGVRWVLPVDSVAADRFAADAQTRVVNSNEIPDGWMGLDIGPQAADEIGSLILNSRTLLWNGPAGVFELEPYSHGSRSLAQAVASATAQGAFSLIGGGDSAAAVNAFGLSAQMSYVSTGGGALLEYMEGKTLPGVAALA